MEKKGYRVMSLADKKSYVSRDVVFYEETFPFTCQQHAYKLLRIASSETFHDSSETFHEISYDQAIDAHSQVPLASNLEVSNMPQRLHKTPSYLGDYVLCSSTEFCRDQWSATTTNLCIQPPSMSSFFLSSHNQQLLSNLVSIEPAGYEEVVLHLRWQNAMEKKFQALFDNHTWDIVPLPAGMKPISCTWVYKVKFKADGSIERLKARLVIRGFTQREGIDYSETFSPMVKMTTIRTLMSVVIKKKWSLPSFMVIYMKLPQGLTSRIPNVVYKLKNFLYGLKQASTQWHAKLAEVLYKRGYQYSENDYSLFYKK